MKGLWLASRYLCWGILTSWWISCKTLAAMSPSGGVSIQSIGGITCCFMENPLMNYEKGTSTEVEFDHAEGVLLLTDYKSNKVWSVALSSLKSTTSSLLQQPLAFTHFAGNGNNDLHKGGNMKLEDASFPSPMGIVSSLDNEIFVASNSANVIQKIFANNNSTSNNEVRNGAWMVENLNVVSESNDPFLKQPTSLALDNNRRLLFVVDSGNQLIRVIDLNSNKLTSLKEINLSHTFSPEIWVNYQNQFIVYQDSLIDLVLESFYLNDIQSKISSSMVKGSRELLPSSKIIKKIRNTMNLFKFLQLNSRSFIVQQHHQRVQQQQQLITTKNYKDQNDITMNIIYPGVKLFPYSFNKDMMEHENTIVFLNSLLENIEIITTKVIKEDDRKENENHYQYLFILSWESKGDLQKQRCIVVWNHNAQSAHPNVEASGTCIYHPSIGLVIQITNDWNSSYALQIDQSLLKQAMLSTHIRNQVAPIVNAPMSIPQWKTLHPWLIEKQFMSNRHKVITVRTNDEMVSPEILVFVHITLPKIVQMSSNVCQKDDVIMIDISRSVAIEDNGSSKFVIRQRWMSMSLEVDAITSNTSAAVSSATRLDKFLSTCLTTTMPCFIPTSLLLIDTQYSISVKLCDLDSGVCGNSTTKMNTVSTNATQWMLPPRAIIRGPLLRTLYESSKLSLTTTEFSSSLEVNQLGKNYLEKFSLFSSAACNSSIRGLWTYFWTLHELKGANDDDSTSTDDDPIGLFVGDNADNLNIIKEKVKSVQNVTDEDDEYESNSLDTSDIATMSTSVLLTSIDNTFVIDPNILESTGTYLVTLVVQDATTGLSTMDYSILHVLRSPLNVKVLPSTNQVLPVNKTMTLDASMTYDPDDVFADISLFNFSWNCHTVSSPLATDLIIDSSSCPLVLSSTTNSQDSSWIAHLVASDDTMINKTALITVTVMDQTSTKLASHSLAVLVIDKTDPVIDIDATAVTNFNVKNNLLLEGTISLPAVESASSKSCIAAWSEASNKLPLSEVALTSISTRVTSSHSTQQISLPLYIRADALKSGESYNFVLSCGSTSRNMIGIVTNPPPQLGVFEVSPLQGGKELITLFTLSTSQWIDDDLPITYQFAYFPVSIRSDQRSLVLQSRSEQAFVGTILPRGVLLTGSVYSRLNVSITAYDALDAQNDDLIRTVNITVDESKSQREKEKQIYHILTLNANQSTIMPLLSVATDVINHVNCSLADSLFCSSLNRDVCSSVANTCGDCLDGYIGEEGHYNSKCIENFSTVSSVSFRSLRSNKQSSAASTSLYSELSRISKKCPGDCSGHGECRFVNSANYSQVYSSCSIVSDECEARCVCNVNFNEDSFGCSRSNEEITTQRSIRALMMDTILAQIPLDSDDGIDETEWSNLWLLLNRVIRADNPSDLDCKTGFSTIQTLSTVIRLLTTKLTAAEISQYSDSILQASLSYIVTLINNILSSVIDCDTSTDSVVAVVSTTIESLKTVMDIIVSLTVTNEGETSWNTMIDTSMRLKSKVFSGDSSSTLSIPMTSIEKVIVNEFTDTTVPIVVQPFVEIIDASLDETSVLALQAISMKSQALKALIESTFALKVASDVLFLRVDDKIPSVLVKLPLLSQFPNISTYPRQTYKYECLKGDYTTVHNVPCVNGPSSVSCDTGEAKSVVVTCSEVVPVPYCATLDLEGSSSNAFAMSSTDGIKSITSSTSSNILCDLVTSHDDLIGCSCTRIGTTDDASIGFRRLTSQQRTLVDLGSLSLTSFQVAAGIGSETLPGTVQITDVMDTVLDDSSRQSAIIIGLLFFMLWFGGGLFILAKWKKTKNELAANATTVNKDSTLAGSLVRKKSKKYDAIPGTIANAKKKQNPSVAPLPDMSSSNTMDTSASSEVAIPTSHPPALTYQQQQRKLLAEKERERTIMLDTLMAYLTSVLPAVYTYGFRPADYDPRRRAIGLPPRGRRRRRPVTSSWSMNMMLHELVKNHRWCNLAFTSVGSASGIGSRTSACTCRPWMTIAFELLTFQTMSMFLLGFFLDAVEFSVLSDSTPLGATLTSAAFSTAILGPAITWLFLIISSPTEEEVKLAMNPRTRYIGGSTTTTGNAGGGGTVVKRGKNEQEKLLADSTVIKKETMISKIVVLWKWLRYYLKPLGCWFGTTSSTLNNNSTTGNIAIVNIQGTSSDSNLTTPKITGETKIVTFLPAETIYAQRLLKQSSQSVMPLLQQWARQRLERDKEKQREKDRLILLKRHEQEKKGDAPSLSSLQVKDDDTRPANQSTPIPASTGVQGSVHTTNEALKEIEDSIVRQHQALVDNTVSISALGPTATGVAPNTSASNAITTSSKIMTAMMMNDEFSRFCDQWQLDPQTGHFNSEWTRQRIGKYLNEIEEKKEHCLKELRQVMSQRYQHQQPGGNAASNSSSMTTTTGLTRAQGHTGVMILQQFVFDILGGPHSTKARIFMSKVNEDFGQSLPIVQSWMRIAAAIALFILNFFFIYYTVAKGFSKNYIWQKTYVTICLAQLFLDFVFYEVVECLWIHIFVPSLVSKELRQVQCLLHEVAHQIIATIVSLETLAEEAEEEEADDSDDDEYPKREIMRGSEGNGKEKDKTKATSKEKGSPQGNHKRRKGLVLNAPDYLFVSTKLAKSFPDLVESIFVLLYQTYLPGEELSKYWRSSTSFSNSNNSNTINSSGSSRNHSSVSSRQKSKAANSLFAPALAIISFLVGYVLMPIVSVLPTEVQRFLVRTMLSLFFYACWFLHRLVVSHPLTMAVTFLVIALIIALIIYKIMVVDQQQLEAMISNVSPLPAVVGTNSHGGRRFSALSATSGGFQSRRASTNKHAHGDLIYTNATNTPQNRSRSGTQTLTIDLNLRDDRVLSFDDFDDDNASTLAMALSWHPPVCPPSPITSPQLGSASNRKGFFAAATDGIRFGTASSSPPRSNRNSRVEDQLYPLQNLPDRDEEDQVQSFTNHNDEDGDHDDDDDEQNRHHDSDEEGYEVEELIVEDHDHDIESNNRGGTNNGGVDSNDVKGIGKPWRSSRHINQDNSDSDSDNEQYGKVVVRYPSRIANI